MCYLKCVHPKAKTGYANPSERDLCTLKHVVAYTRLRVRSFLHLHYWSTHMIA